MRTKKSDYDPIPYLLEKHDSLKLFVTKPLYWLDHVNTPTESPLYFVWYQDKIIHSGMDYRTAYSVYKRILNES